MWLGSQQLLASLDTAAVPVLSSSVRIQETARDLGVVIDSRLSLSDHVAAVCRSGYYIIINCDSFGRLSGPRRKTQRRQWSRPLLSVVWTTVTRCATTSPTNWRAACSQFRTLPPGSWWAPGDAIISRLRLSSTSPCPATRRVTWPTTVSSWPTPVSDNHVLPTLEHSLSVGVTAVLETGPLPPQDHKSETVCRPISDYVMWAVIRPVQAVAEDTVVRTVRPRRSVNCF